jgi:hypothetical protein
MLRPKNRVSVELPGGLEAKLEDWRLRPECISRRLYLEEARARQTDSSIFNIRNKQQRLNLSPFLEHSSLVKSLFTSTCP